jgi:hypothetical protein
VEQAIKVLKAPESESALSDEVQDLRSKLQDLRGEANDNAIRDRQRAALQRVAAAMSRFLPKLDAERPLDPAELNIEDLTIRVTSPSGRRDFLWEIGSGANWLSYHVAAMLALHELFLTKHSNPVPSFLILDQPSQVYFPRKLGGRATGPVDPQIADEDITAVRMVFDVLAQAVGGEAGLQVLVLDHASSDIWGDIPRANLVEEWRDGNALIPMNWL